MDDLLVYVDGRWCICETQRYNVYAVADPRGEGLPMQSGRGVSVTPGTA